MSSGEGDDQQAGRAVGSALVWNLANQLLTQLVSLGVFLLLARQLSPAAFGVFALALLFVEAFASEARSALTDVLVMRRQFDRRDLSAVLIVSTAGALAVWSGLALLSPVIGEAFRAQDVTEILPWLGVAILLAPLQAVYEAQALHRLAFRGLAQRNMIASLVGAAGALLTLFAGFGLWALVVQRLLISAVGLAFLAVMLRWAPVLAVDRGAGQGVLRPFVKLWLGQMINFASGRTVDLIIGLKLGTSALGVYRVALRMVETVQSLATRPLMSAFLPVLARHPPASAEQREQYLQIVALAALLAVAPLAGLGLVAPELTSVLLDARYTSVDMVLGLLALAGLVAPLSYFRGVALTAAHRPGAAAWLAAAELASLVVWVWLAASVGLVWAAAGVAASSILLALVSAATLVRVLGLSVAALARACGPAYLACASMAAAVVAGRWALEPHLPAGPRLAVLVALGAAAFAAHVALVHRDWVRARIAYVRRGA